MSKNGKAGTKKRKSQTGAAGLGSVGVEVPTSFGPFEHLGAPGFAVYGGYVVDNEKDQRLSRSRRFETYADILANVSIVAAGIRFFINLVAKAAWKVEPADDSAEAEEKAQLVEEIMGDLSTPWHRVVRRAAMFRFYGFSVQEWTAKRRDDGVIGFQDIEPRAQRTIEQWDTDENGSVLGVVQRSPQDFERLYIPRGKCVYLVDDSLDDTPEGLGLFRHLAKPADRLARYELLEAWGFEQDLRGIPIGRMPLTEINKLVKAGTISEQQAREMRQPLEDIVRAHARNPEMGLLLDSMTYKTTDEKAAPSTVRQWDLDLLKGEPVSTEQIANAIMRINREMARTLGVEHLLLGDDGRGSYALSRDKTMNFGLLVDSTLKELQETFSKDVLEPLWDLNGWDWDILPTYRIEQVQYRDVEQLTQALLDISKAGAPLDPEDPAINEIRGLLGLSDAVVAEMADPDLTLLGNALAGEDLPLPNQGEGSGDEDAVPEAEDEGTDD